MSERGHETGGRQEFANQMRFSRSSSMDTTDRQYAPAVHNKYHQQQQPPPKQPYAYRGMPPAYPPPPHPNMRHQAPPGYPYSPQTRGPPQNGRLQSVVTSSFSIEDEREDTAGPRGYYHHHHRGAAPSHQEEDRHPSEPAACREQHDEREIAPRDSFGSHREAPPMFDARAPPNAKPATPIRIPPSPGDGRQLPEEAAMVATTPQSKVTADNLKRSFWHHSRPADSTHHSMHPAFAPPKRAKLGPLRKERDVVITPRTPGSEGQEYARANSWAGPDDESHRHYRQTNSFPSPWDQHQQHVRQASSFGGYPEPGMAEHYQRTWSSDETASDRAGAAFRSVQDRPQPPPRPYNPIAHQGSFSSQQPQQRHWGRAESYDWSPEQHQWQQHQHRDDVDGRDLRARSYSREMSWDDRDGDMRRQVTFEPNAYRYCDGQQQHKITPNTDVPRSILKRNDSMNEDMASSQREGPILLLAQQEDRISLSETLCTIRENIEVFMATKTDVEAPAPGRKHPVVVGQVGLRCIHCRHTTKSSDRVKRAVCYPSSIKRIYRTVIDMKLDHFAHCRFVPNALKDRLEELKAINTRSTGTTMQYFVRAASKMGMVDASSGVRLVDSNPEESSSAPSSPKRNGPAVTSPQLAPSSPVVVVNSPLRSASDVSVGSPISEKKLVRTDSGSSDISMAASDTSTTSIAEVPEEVFMGKVPLSVPEDTMALSPLRCFLRENVCAFTATDEDIAVRTPTTFSVGIGQVGIGCVHCHALPAKERSNRAVCFPFAINRIYQSVADIQRFHLAECKMVPPEARAKFQELQSASSKGSKGLATRQYWVTSAKKIGLIDTAKGIRFGRDPAVPAAQAISLDILAQVASNVTTVDRPLVFPEDKPFIADFLYAVMEMLQPCRFTEADRNKRRLKDVGCIGVECKHCAGQVESRKFFWSSVNAVESNFVSVHTHMIECKSVPDELKTKLTELKALRKEQTTRLKTGSQKAFFQRVWKRLHDGDETDKQSPQEGKTQEETKEKEELKATLDAQLVTIVKSSKERTSTGAEQSAAGAHLEKVNTDIQKMAVTSVEV
jgi:hypothetical protein